MGSSESDNSSEGNKFFVFLLFALLLPLIYVFAYTPFIVFLDNNTASGDSIFSDAVTFTALPLAWLYEHFGPFKAYVDFLDGLVG